MKKRVLSLVLTLSIVSAWFAAPPLNAATVSSGTCGDKGDNLTWTLDSAGTLTIIGTGRMQDYVQNRWEQEDPPWNRSRVQKVILAPGVTSIGERAFQE